MSQTASQKRGRAKYFQSGHTTQSKTQLQVTRVTQLDELATTHRKLKINANTEQDAHNKKLVYNHIPKQVKQLQQR